MNFLAITILALAPAWQQDEPSDEKIKEMVEQLGADYEEEREAAREKLAKVGIKAEPHLIDALANTDYRVRKICLELLVDMKSTKACEKVAAIFRTKGEEKTVQAIAFKYIARCGKAAEDVMVEALDSAEESYRLGALEALLEMKSTRCADKSAALYEKDASKAIKARALELLKSSGEKARPHLIKLLANADVGVRLGAIQSLKSMNTNFEELLDPVSKMLKIETDINIQTEGFAVLTGVGAKAEPHFIESLKATSEHIRRLSIEGLRKIKSTKALDGISDVFQNDASESVREEAFEYLADSGLAAEPAFITALDHKNAPVRLKAIKGLGRIKSEKVYDQMARLFREDKNAEVHESCYQYLESLGIKAEKDLLWALKNDDTAGLRIRVIKALGYAQSLNAIAPLMEIVEHMNPEVRAAARSALVTIGPKAIEAVNEAFDAKKLKKEGRDAVLALYYQAGVDVLLDRQISENMTTGAYADQWADLVKFGKERAIPVLLRIITDVEYEFRVDPKRADGQHFKENMRALAMLALGEIGDKPVLDLLQKLEVAESETALFVEWQVARHKLGDPKPLTDYVENVNKNLAGILGAEDRESAYRDAAAGGRMLTRVGRHDDAFKVYSQVVKSIESGTEPERFKDALRTTLYNSACVLVKQGKKAEAAAMLGRAVDAGFRDLGWIKMDKDLDPIRGEDAYKKLVEDPARFKPLLE